MIYPLVITVVPFIVFLVIIGIVLYFLRDTLHPKLMAIIIVIVVLLIALWLLDAFGIFPMPAAFHLSGGK